MSNLESLVPPLELCKQIPTGKFEDSALVWRWNGKSGAIFARAGYPNETYPAPTLAEILIAEPKIAGIFRYDPDKKLQKVIWVAEYLSEKCGPVWIHDETPATAALKLWLELEGGKE